MMVLTPAERATVLDAADELERLAADVRRCHTIPPDYTDWNDEREAHAEFNTLTRLVKRLRRLHKRATPWLR